MLYFPGSKSSNLKTGGRLSRKALLVAIGIMTAVACSPRAADAPDTSADEAKIRAEAPIWFDLHTKGDADGVADLYADDAIVLAPGVPAAVGKEAIRAFAMISRPPRRPALPAPWARSTAWAFPATWPG